MAGHLTSGGRSGHQGPGERGHNQPGGRFGHLGSGGLLSLLVILLFSSCNESPDQAWKRASDKLREASKLYVALADAANVEARAVQLVPNAPENAENQRGLTIALLGFSAALDAKRCTEIADKLETFAEFEKPTSGQFTETNESVADLLKSAENSTTNPKLTSVMRPDQRRGFIKAHSLVKEASEILKDSQPLSSGEGTPNDSRH